MGRRGAREAEQDGVDKGEGEEEREAREPVPQPVERRGAP